MFFYNKLGWLQFKFESYKVHINIKVITSKLCNNLFISIEMWKKSVKGIHLFHIASFISGRKHHRIQKSSFWLHADWIKKLQWKACNLQLTEKRMLVCVDLTSLTATSAFTAIQSNHKKHECLWEYSINSNIRWNQL